MKQNQSFQPHKCLLYKKQFDGIINKKIEPPIEVNIDPVNACNMNCLWCNGKRVMNGKMMSYVRLVAVIKNIAEWGVSAICWAGGGEKL